MAYRIPQVRELAETGCEQLFRRERRRESIPRLPRLDERFEFAEFAELQFVSQGSIVLVVESWILLLCAGHAVLDVLLNVTRQHRRIPVQIAIDDVPEAEFDVLYIIAEALKLSR